MTPAGLSAAALRRWVGRVRARAGEYRLRYLLAVLAFEMFVAGPLAQMGVLSHLVVDLSFGLLVITGVASVAGRREQTAILAAVGVLGLIARSIHVGQANRATAVLASALSMLLVVLLTATVLGPVLSRGRITGRRIEGAIAVYLLLAIVWGMGYRLLTIFVPGAFNVPSPDAYALQYFSLVTLTTAGYGDIVPVHPLARSLAAAEAVTGPLYLAILIARLVSQDLAAQER